MDRVHEVVVVALIDGIAAIVVTDGALGDVRGGQLDIVHIIAAGIDSAISIDVQLGSAGQSGIVAVGVYHGHVGEAGGVGNINVLGIAGSDLIVLLRTITELLADVGLGASDGTKVRDEVTSIAANRSYYNWLQPAIAHLGVGREGFGPTFGTAANGTASINDATVVSWM